MWEIFRKYHYLNTELHTAAEQYIGMVNGEIVCHTGIIQMPIQRGKKRVHRLVVLPDYQGIGIGTAFIKQVAETIKGRGYELNLTTTTPALVGALKRDPKWILGRYGRQKEAFVRFEQNYGINRKTALSATNSCKRITFSFWYK